MLAYFKIAGGTWEMCTAYKLMIVVSLPHMVPFYLIHQCPLIWPSHTHTHTPAPQAWAMRTHTTHSSMQIGPNRSRQRYSVYVYMYICHIVYSKHLDTLLTWILHDVTVVSSRLISPLLPSLSLLPSFSFASLPPPTHTHTHTHTPTFQLVRNVLTVDFHLTKYRTIVQDLQKEVNTTLM